MDTSILAALIGIVAGAIGYWFATFSVQPILRYRDLRNKVLSDFIYFAQVINANGLNDEMQELHRKRVLANRKASAALSAAVFEPTALVHYISEMRGTRSSGSSEAPHRLLKHYRIRAIPQGAGND